MSETSRWWNTWSFRLRENTSLKVLKLLYSLSVKHCDDVFIGRAATVKYWKDQWLHELELVASGSKLLNLNRHFILPMARWILCVTCSVKEMSLSKTSPRVLTLLQVNYKTSCPCEVAKITVVLTKYFILIKSNAKYNTKVNQPFMQSNKYILIMYKLYNLWYLLHYCYNCTFHCS